MKPSIEQAHREVSATLYDDVPSGLSNLGIGVGEAWAVAGECMDGWNGRLKGTVDDDLSRASLEEVGHYIFIEGLATGLQFARDRAHQRESAEEPVRVDDLDSRLRGICWTLDEAIRRADSANLTDDGYAMIASQVTLLANIVDIVCKLHGSDDDFVENSGHDRKDER